MYENEMITGQNNMNQSAELQPMEAQLVEQQPAGPQPVELQSTEPQPVEKCSVTETIGTESAGAGASTYFDYISSPGPVKPEPVKSTDNGSKVSSPQIEKAVGTKKGSADEDCPKKKSGIFRKFVLSVSLGLCFGLFAGLGFYVVQLGIGQLNYQDEQDQQEQNQQEQDQQMKAASGDSVVLSPDLRQAIQDELSKYGFVNQVSYSLTDASNVVKQVMPAMVSIINNSTETQSFWGQTYTTPVAYSGSGIIVAQKDEELLIVTNNHVVEGTNSLEITFIDGSTAEAVIKGLDADMDLAVIAVRLSKLSEDTKGAITIATLGNSDNLELGEQVIAIGNALGYGQSVSGGMVSALARELTFDDGSTGIFIQTDAAINPGNSGGALLNMKGEVIGINSSKIGGTYVEGMGYAIPITSASPIIAELMDRQTREQKVTESERGYLGIRLQALDATTAQLYGMPQGAYVRSVDEDSAAAEAGLLHGDIIVSFDGQRISSTVELTNAMEYYCAGETVKMTIKRIIDGEYRSVELEITLGRRP